MTDSNKEDKNLQCSFCGKNREEVKKLIAGPSSYICNECISISHKIVNEDDSDIAELEFNDIPIPEVIKSHLDQYVIGQHHTKEVLSVNAYNHYKRIFMDETEPKVEKSNILMIGSTGTGKTLLASTLAKMLKVPFTIADATTLTEAGYVGEDVESLIERLLNNCNWDIAQAQRGIVFIDEVDKKARSSESNTSTKDISGEGVQQALLRLIEGTTIKVPTGTGKRMDDFVEVNTKDILFICSGSFVGIDKLVSKRIKKKNIGFNSELTLNEEDTTWQESIDQEDIISYGLIPEFVGRLPIITTLKDLTESDMIQILTESKASIIPQVQKLLEFDNVELNFGNQYFKDVAKLAKKKKTGARGLKSIVENSLHNIMYRAPKFKSQGINQVLFEKYPNKNIDSYPFLLYNNGNKVLDKEYKIKLRGAS